MEHTHTVRITVTGHYPGGDRSRASVSIDGDGQLEHMIEAFRAALVAAGFSLDVAKKLDEWDV